MAVKDTAQKHLLEQREYVRKRHLENQRAAIAASGGGSGLVDEKMLAQSMRSVRYADEAHAGGDIVDNAIESGASQVHVIYKTQGSAITDIAFADNGSGIEDVFLPHATKWGGSSNEGRRNIFGRFGFGLPSASVNRGRSYRVFSRTDSSKPFKAVGIDLDHLGAIDGVVPLPTVQEAELPDWVRTYLNSEQDGKPVFEGGVDAVRTVVIWNKFDRLTWKNKQQSASRFLEHFGITYASWLDVVKLFVDGQPVEPVDVLFTTPGYRWYDVDGAPRADAQDSIRFEVPDEHGEKHPVTLRFSLLSVGAYNAEVPTGGRGRPIKMRKKIRTDYNGIFVTRNGRFIELGKPALINWSNYARQVGVALDFPPELDEVFGVTPDKQTITFNDRVEQLLASHGVERAFKALYKLVEEERKRLKAERDAGEHGDGPRPSEATIAKVIEMDVRKSKKQSEEARKEAEQNLKRKVKDIARQTGLDEKDIQAAHEKQQQEKPYKVEFVRQTEDEPFYTPYMEGVQLVLRINTEHPWYRELYSKLDETQSELRSGLELMLWVLATSEIDSSGDTRVFYRAERAHWSKSMADAFDLHPLVFNKVSSRAEVEENETAPWEEDEEGNGTTGAE